MIVSLALSPSLRQRPALDRRLRQSLHLLQMPRTDLEQYLEEELAANPFLERLIREDVPPGVDSYEAPRGEQAEREELSLLEHLTQQWKALEYPPDEETLGLKIIEDLDGNGYLESSVEELARENGSSAAEIGHILSRVQELEPAGVACRDLAECLLLQLGRKGDALSRLAARVVLEAMDELAADDVPAAARCLGLSKEDTHRAFERVRRLSPRPGAGFGAVPDARVAPDIQFRKKGRHFEAVLVRGDIPELRIHASYKRMLTDPGTPEDARRFLRQKLASAMELMNALQKRENTLTRLARLVAVEQKDFFLKGRKHLKPLRMDKMARRLDVHPSTVTRAVAGKYAQTPHGLVALHDLFARPAVELQARIAAIVRTEKGAAFSDRQIAERLAAEGRTVSRRTVAKYRLQNRLPVSFKRRKRT